MERAADWQLANPPKWKPTEWHNAAFYAGVMALVPLSESDRFHDAMVKMGEGNEWKLGPRPYHADDHAVGQTYVDLFLLDGGAEGSRRCANRSTSFSQIRRTTTSTSTATRTPIAPTAGRGAMRCSWRRPRG
jgi:hypothetical protein